jgi:hypothetical protein
MGLPEQASRVAELGLGFRIFILRGALHHWEQVDGYHQVSLFQVKKLKIIL